MASNYPSGLDTFTNPAGTDNLAAGIGHAAQHDNINDAVRAVEVELGTTPKGSDASVAARLARFDANGFVTPIRTSGGYFDTATNYTLTNNDRVVDVTGTTAITLPTSTGSAGRTFTVRNNGAGTVTIGTTGGQLIDGAATLALAGKGYAEVVSDGTGWHVLGAQYADETVGRRIFTWNHAYSTGGGFQTTYSDTGIRTITSWDAAGVVTGTALPTGWAPVSGQAGYFRIQRVGSRVTASIAMLQSTGTNPTPLAIPTGFASPSNPQFLVPMVPGAGAQVSRTWQNSAGLGRGASSLFTANDYVYATEITWQTTDAWPTALPGTAFGVIPQ